MTSSLGLWVRNGDETVEGGQCRQAVFVRYYDAFCDYAVHDLTVDHDGVDAIVAEFEMQADVTAVGSGDGEVLADGEQGQDH